MADAAGVRTDVGSEHIDAARVRTDAAGLRGDAESISRSRPEQHKPGFARKKTGVGGERSEAEDRGSRIEDRAAAAATDKGQVETHFWLSRGDQLLVALLAVVALGLMVWHWARLSGWGMQPVEIEQHPARRYDYRIDINEATWVEWAQFKGIGETLAERIVEDRRTNGPFQSIDDLQRVKGIGPRTIEKLRPYLTVNGSQPERTTNDEIPNDEGMTNDK